MAVSVIWPASLPQRPRQDYSEDLGARVLRTPVDKGPAKERYLGQRPDVLNVSFEMTNAQLATFETLVKTTLRYTRRFGFPHPRTGLQVEARIVPQGEGSYYRVSYWTPAIWLVDFVLEVLP